MEGEGLHASNRLEKEEEEGCVYPPTKGRSKNFFPLLSGIGPRRKKPFDFWDSTSRRKQWVGGELFSPSEIEVGFLKIRLMVLFSPPDCQ